MPARRPPELLTDDRYGRILTGSLHFFTQRVFAELEPGRTFVPSSYLQVIASALEDCRLGRTKRLIINVPPRHTKSLLASIAFPAWLLGHDPGARIICVSYGQDLADDFARKCKAVMSSSWYQVLFPTELGRLAISDLTTGSGGERIATSVGGVLTGRGADYIIIDDPMKPDEAISDTRRKAANDWFDNTARSRLNSQSGGVVIIVMQRLHTDDLVGHLLEKGDDWEILSFPAIAEDEEEFSYDTLFGQRVFRRRPGEVLDPVRFSKESLDNLRAAMGSYNFSAQYQQRPVPLEGNFVKRSWLRSYGSWELNEPFPLVLQSWDTANKVGELNDFSVCTTWGVREKRYYLLDVTRQRLEYPDLKRAVCMQAQRFKATTILVEDKASGTQLVQDLKGSSRLPIRAVTPPALEKAMRLRNHQSVFEEGRVLLPEVATWLDAYVAELTGFPGTKHDDQVDSTTQALTHLETGRRKVLITPEMLQAARNFGRSGR